MTDTVPALKAVGKYRLDAVLGRGGMGVVYRAFDTLIERPVALKTIHHHLLAGADGEDLRARFHREVKAAARCNHPNIITIYDYGEHNEAPFIVMELIEGREVRTCLAERGAFPLNDATAIVLQALEALDFAHQAGVLHRDIKPSNVLLLSDGRLKLTDFGVARLDDRSGQTQVGSMVGTPAYMAPEQLRGEATDASADLYAVGVMLFEMISGLHPSPGRAFETLQDFAEGQCETGADPGQALPRGLYRVLAKALATRRKARYPDAKAFSEALRAALDVGNLETLIGTTTYCREVSPARPQDEPVPDGSSYAWPAETLDWIERGLAEFMGPMARMLVRQQSRKAEDLSTLVARLAEHIPDPQERRAFLGAFEAHDSTGHAAAAGAPDASSEVAADPLPSALLAEAETRLAEHIGPMAKMALRKTARQATDKADLYQRLARFITDPQARERFLEQGRG